MKKDILMEPFKIKSVEPLPINTRSERKKILEKAKLNLFFIPAKEVIIDLLTDSGTGAMSSSQWSALLRGDESYAGGESFFRFQKSIQSITQMPYVIPVHQGRAAERIVLKSFLSKGEYVVSNTLFDTTRANAHLLGFKILDIPCEEFKNTQSDFGFKGNIDLLALESALIKKSVACVVMTLTNNSCAGQPVSLQNIKQASALCKKHNTPFVLDACRFAENSYFIKQREKQYKNKNPLEIAKELFSLADICFVSAKKDGLAHIGGFIALKEGKIAEKFKEDLTISEGFPTYGGLAGRDLEAIALGLHEALEEPYLQYRTSSIKYLHQKLVQADVPVIHPAGGHAVYIDAQATLPHIPQSAYPAQCFVSGLYEFSGVRSCEIGSVMFGSTKKDGTPVFHTQELVRLAIPRRVYTLSHLDYVAHSIKNFMQEVAPKLKGVKMTYAPATLRQFHAEFKFLE